MFFTWLIVTLFDGVPLSTRDLCAAWSPRRAQSHFNEFDCLMLTLNIRPRRLPGNNTTLFSSTILRRREAKEV